MTMGLRVLDDEEVEGRVGGRDRRPGFLVGIGIGASPCVVFSYRMAIRFISSRKDGLRTDRVLPILLVEGMMCAHLRTLVIERGVLGKNRKHKRTLSLVCDGDDLISN